jgi:hypothetical protein
MCDIHEAAVMGNLSVPEQLCEQCQGVLRKHGIHEAFLPLECLNRAAAGLVIVVESRIDNFRIELRHCPQTRP